jgi:ketosteroid isomerase-like protein
VVIFESGNVESNRAEYASHHLQADAAFSAAVPRTLVSRTHGEAGDTAWVMNVETVSGTYRNRPISSRSVETMLLRRIDGQWRIQHIHWSSADLPPQ